MGMREGDEEEGMGMRWKGGDEVEGMGMTRKGWG